jgi:hypothetical protein
MGSFTWWQSQDLGVTQGYRIIAEYEVLVTYDASGHGSQKYTGQVRLRHVPV